MSPQDTGRCRRALGLLAVGILALPAAQAQQPCSEAEPCVIPIDVDTSSLTFGAEPTYTVTADDWFVFDTFNLDGPDHEIVIADLGISIVAPGIDGDGPSRQHGPYLLDAPGAYEVLDIDSGEHATLVVTEEDVTHKATGRSTPGIGAALTLLAVAAPILRRTRP